MHTPDGFITSWICVVMLLTAAGFLAYAVFDAKRWMTKQKALQLAALAAVIFGAQMLNFPIGNGTSGHLIGASLVTILFGPSAALLVLTLVLIVQAVVYGDGGMLALGINIFNMAIVATYVTYFVYKIMNWKKIGIFVSSATAVVAAALSCAIFIGLSGTIAFSAVIPAMLITHLFIGIGEALMTYALVLFVWKSYVLSSYKWKIGVASLVGAVLVISFALPFASSSPDGLNKVALNLGFYQHAVTIYNAPISGYALLGSGYLSVLSAAVIGMGIVFCSMYLLSRPMSAKTY